MRTISGGALAVALVFGGAFGGAWSAPAAGDAADPGGATAPGRTTRIETREPWTWPVEPPFRLDRPFVAPASAYGPGHRGIDLLPSGGAGVLAPAGGVVAFSGTVAGRGVLTIDHGDGIVTTLEPVDSDLTPGTVVMRGDVVGALGLGGHTAPGRLHLGVRIHGEYVNPLLLLGGVPRAILLPCC